MKKTLKVKPLGLCVCGREIFYNLKQMCVAHQEPACQKFLELEPDEFLTYVRRSRGIPDPPQ